MKIISFVSGLLEDKFREELYNDCFIVDTNFNLSSKKLEIFVDSDSSLDFAKCQKLSRFLEEHIDESQILGEKYTLEVSSPGLERPLKFIRQYKKNIGRVLNLTLVDEGKEISGKLKKVTETDIQVEYTTKVKINGKNKKIIETPTIPLEKIKKAIVAIKF